MGDFQVHRRTDLRKIRRRRSPRVLSLSTVVWTTRSRPSTVYYLLMDTLKGIFRRPTPQEQVRIPVLSVLTSVMQLQKWKGTIRREERLLDRQISSLKEQEDKSRKMIRQMAKKRPQDVGNARILAKELVRARKQRQRMYQSKATLNSIQMQLQEQIGRPSPQKCVLRRATYKISGILKQSTGVMRDVNQLVKIPELNRDMRQFSVELTKVFPIT